MSRDGEEVVRSALRRTRNRAQCLPLVQVSFPKNAMPATPGSQRPTHTPSRFFRAEPGPYSE